MEFNKYETLEQFLQELQRKLGTKLDDVRDQKQDYDDCFGTWTHIGFVIGELHVIQRGEASSKTYASLAIALSPLEVALSDLDTKSAAGAIKFLAPPIFAG